MESISRRFSAEVAALSGVLSAVLSIMILQVNFLNYQIGVFPVAVNVNSILSIFLGISMAAILIERYREQDLFHDAEIVTGSLIMSLISVFTVGLAVPPFNVGPYSLAVALTVGIQAFVFSWFVIPYARSYNYMERIYDKLE
jgi:hypothetical protein